MGGLIDSHYPFLLASSISRAIAPMLNWRMGGLLILMGVFWIVFSFEGGNKSKLTTGKFADWKAKQTARKLAIKQMQNRKRNEVALYIGTPRQIQRNLNPKPRRSLLKRHKTVQPPYYQKLNLAQSVVIPNANRGILIPGGPGTGKTFSAIDRLIWSAFDQAFPTILYDFKGEQMRRHIPYASAKGYDVYVIAPGKPYTHICNPLDFMSSPSDTDMARQLAIVINRNSQTTPDRGNAYFVDAGDFLVQTSLMLAKSSPFPDLLMAYAFLSLPSLAKRLVEVHSRGRLDIWPAISAKSLMSVANAEQTEGGIVSTAVNTFVKFISRNFIPILCGETNIPLDINGKTLIVLQLDQMTRDVASPFIAAIIHLMVMRNLSVRRQEPLVFFDDEAPTLYLPDLAKWVNEYRENGFVAVMGYQNKAQLEERYGRERAQSIVAACGTKLIFNPQDTSTAEDFSKMFGEKEVTIKTRSQSQGKSPGTSRSEQVHKVALVTADSLMKMPTGQCVVINPGYSSKKEAGIPFIQAIRVPPKDIAKQSKSESLWDSHAQPELIRRTSKNRLQLDDRQLSEALAVRESLAKIMLPLNDELKESAALAAKNRIQEEARQIQTATMVDGVTDPDDF